MSRHYDQARRRELARVSAELAPGPLVAWVNHPPDTLRYARNAALLSRNVSRWTLAGRVCDDSRRRAGGYPRPIARARRVGSPGRHGTHVADVIDGRRVRHN